MRRLFAVAAVLALFAPPAMAQGASTWEIDPAHANAQFVVRHLGISNVQGEFTHVTGTIQLDEKDATKSSVSATIDVNSVNTRNAERDADLRSAHFFDVSKFPTMSFRSKNIVQTAKGRLQVAGDLTLHGVTREVVLDVEGPSDAIKDPWGGTRRGVSATAKIDRRDFGITTYPGAVIGGQITITLDFEMVRKP